jgi:hypothetical protein
VFHHAVNEGPFVAANRGLDVARGSFIARLDADDRARPDRLARQLAFLDAHPEVGIVGSAYGVMDDAGRLQRVRTVPASDLAIRWQALLVSPFLHSSVLIRREVMRKHHLVYDPDLRMGGDYELWSRLLPHTLAANLSEPLVDFRIWSGSISTTARPAQRAIHDEVALRCIANQLPELPLGQGELVALRHLLVDEELGQSPAVRRHLAQEYCGLFAAFARRHAGAPELAALSADVAARAEQLAR